MAHDLLLKECRLYDAAGEPPVDIYVASGRIVRIAPHGAAAPGREAEGFSGTLPILDAGGRIVIPGLIDIHVHGAGGADVLDGTPEALETIARALARLGTTSFLGTTFLRPAIEERHLPTTAACVGREWGGANLLGLHLEGPFINVKRKGGIPEAAIQPPSLRALDGLLALTDGQLRMMTVAPELAGSHEIISALADRGVIPSFGHSDATYVETVAAFRAGIRHVTHLYNAMPPLHHRDPGPIPAVFEASDVAVQLIGDGVHVHPAVLRWTCQQLGMDRCIGITDGMRATGLPEGRYDYSGRAFESRDGVARYLDGTLIGTAMSLLEVAHRMREYTGCAFRTAIDSVTRVPACVLGIDDRKGSIAPGKDADLVVLEPDGTVRATVVGGAVAGGAKGSATSAQIAAGAKE